MSKLKNWLMPAFWGILLFTVLVILLVTPSAKAGSSYEQDVLYQLEQMNRNLSNISRELSQIERKMK